jgi:hypothetical protein
MSNAEAVTPENLQVKGKPVLTSFEAIQRRRVVTDKPRIVTDWEDGVPPYPVLL